MIAKFSWAVALSAQGLWSASSFLLSMMLARYLEMADFGVFGILFALRSLALLVLSATILSPLTILAGRTQTSTDTDQLLGSVFVHVVGILIAIAVVVLGIAAAVVLPSIVVPAGLYLVGGVMLALCRRSNYILARGVRDVWGGVAHFAAAVGGIWLLNQNFGLNLSHALYWIGGVELLGALLNSRWKWLRRPSRLPAGTSSRAWSISRWVLGGNLAAFAYTQASTFFTLFLLGPAGVALLEVGRIPVRAVNVLLQGAANYWQPRLARSANQDEPRAFYHRIWQAAAWQTMVNTVLLLVLAVTAPLLIELMVPGRAEEYAQSITVIRVICFAMVLRSLWQHPVFGMDSLGWPHYTFAARAIAALITLPLAYILTRSAGVVGAAASAVAGEAIVLLLAAYLLAKSIDKASQGKP